MNIKIKNSTIKVDMVKQMEECRDSFGEDVSTLVTSPATNKFFEVREYAEQLSENKGKLFHLVVEKLSFIMKSFRTDLEMVMGFLTTRVSKSDIDNREKL